MKIFPNLLFIVVLLLWLPNSLAANNEAVGRALTQLFQGSKATTGSKFVDSHLAAIKSYYAKRNFKPIWVRDNGPKGKAKALVAEIRISSVHGLSPEFYNFNKIDQLLNDKNPANLARLELLLSGSFVEFGHDLRNGRIGPGIEGSMNAIHTQTPRPEEYIRNAESAGNLREYMGGLLQSDKRYVRLITKLSELTRTRGSGLWPKFSDGEITSITAGQSAKVLNKIRKLLVLTGDMPLKDMSGGPVHDETSVAAVKKFQSRHGLTQTGNIDPDTAAAMSVRLKTRIGQIRINLERRRWQVHAISNEHVYVNLASKSLRVVSGGKTVSEYRLRKVEPLADIPAFIGALGCDKPVSQAELSNGISVNSEYISMISPAEAAGSLWIDDYDKFVGEICQLAQNSSRQIENKNTVPIFVTYVTTWATSNGQMHFRKDIFARDEILAKLLKPAN